MSKRKHTRNVGKGSG